MDYRTNIARISRFVFVVVFVFANAYTREQAYTARYFLFAGEKNKKYRHTLRDTDFI